MTRFGMWSGFMATVVATIVGCGGDDEADEKGGSGGSEPAVKTEAISLLADTNRDGYVDEADNLGEELWSVDYGAAFLPNYDDDNGDLLRDADNAVVDGDADAWDLAPVFVEAFEGAPDSALGRIDIDDWAVPHIRIFKLVEGVGWELVAGSDGPCGAGGDATCYFSSNVIYLTAAEVKAGVQLGIEGKTLTGLPGATSPDPSGQQVPWSGLVQLDYAIFETPESEAPITTADQPDGVDRLQLRVAPWIMFGNTTPNLDTIFSNTVMPAFVQGNQAVADAEGVEYWRIENWQDHWTEDWMQTGFVSVPGADGAVHGMRLAMPRPWGRSNVDSALPVNWLAQNLVYPESGYFVVYRQPHSGNSYDSHGNHDLIPAYDNPANGQSFPYGRIIHGSGIQEQTKIFYDAQVVQGPSLEVNTSWLIVGHVDEVFSYAPAATERGWKLLVGSPDMAVQMLTEWSQQGHGDAVMFEGKQWSNGQSAAITVDEALADQDIMAWSQQGQAQIDGMLAVIQQEVGLTEDEIVEIPFLFEQDYGALVALNPGTVNSYIADEFINIPDPFGPNIDGVDGFKQDLQDRLGTSAHELGFEGQGLRVYFTDDWDWYHALLGEVHCGTNYSGPPQPEIQWWGAMQ